MKTISVFYCLLYGKCINEIHLLILTTQNAWTFVTWSPATWTKGESINIQGFERGEVSFHCLHRHAQKNNKYLCKDPCKTSKDVLVSVESGLRAESGRITLVDLGDGVFIVTFSQLQLSDSGRYWCAVDRIGVDTFIAVHLTVKEGTYCMWTYHSYLE